MKRTVQVSSLFLGQPITVVEKRAASPGVVRFETNRSLTGMGHEHYRPGEDNTGIRPPDELARRLFARGGIDHIHIYSNVITVDLAEGGATDGMADVIHGLFTYYTPGVVPPSDEELMGDDAPAPA